MIGYIYFLKGHIPNCDICDPFFVSIHIGYNYLRIMDLFFQRIVGCTQNPTYPVMGIPYISPAYHVGIYGLFHPQESQGGTQ